MSEARLLINSEEEFELNGDLISIGRASDNTISFSEDSNVSRYHAEIERRGGSEYWIFDLNSSNGTTLNGERVTTEKPLFDNDVLMFGGTSKIQVSLSAPEEEEENEEKEEEEENTEQQTEPTEDVQEEAPKQNASKVSLLLILAGLAMGLAVISVFAVAIFYFTRGDGILGNSSCQAQATIISPKNGEFVKKTTNIEINLENGECVKKVAFLIDGTEFATAETEPFSAELDPSKFPTLAADGLDHKLSLVLKDENDNVIVQSGEIALALETIKTAPPKKPDEENPDGNPQTTQRPPVAQTQDSNMSLIDFQKMTNKVLPQFRGSFEYKANNPDFLKAVRKMTAEYASEGYFERAKKYSDVIAREYIQNRDLDPPLGFILAMSRTKFEPTNQVEGAGLWRMNNNLVLESAYNGTCGAETIAAPTQKCASIASSVYLKDIVKDVFEGDIIYGIAAFGLSKNEAIAWKDTLPPKAQRQDFWNVIGPGGKRDEVVRFFAAATVAENPQNYGLTKDRPLSELYKSYMQ